MRIQLRFSRTIFIGFQLLLLLSPLRAQVAWQVIEKAQVKTVKIYGSGGFAGLHSYQTGFFWKSDGHIVTSWSHVLDYQVRVVNAQGRRFVAKFIGMDPVTELALLKIDASDCPSVQMDPRANVFPGKKVVGICNVFGIANGKEPLSVLQGTVSSMSSLNGKTGRFETPFKGNIIMVDMITNNPGAAGGLVIDSAGHAIGLIGKELKDKNTRTWINFCLPMDVVENSIRMIQSGKARREPIVPAVVPFSFDDIGLELIPHVLPGTRPFVNRTSAGSVARKLGFLPNDLILFVDRHPVRNIAETQKVIQSIDRDQAFSVTLKRDQELRKIRVSRTVANE